MVEVVAALLQDASDARRFLICQRPAHKARGRLWAFVGGKVEPGETKEATLIRECREELGIQIAVGELYMELTHVYPDITIHMTAFSRPHRRGRAAASRAQRAALDHPGGDRRICVLSRG